jgi:hypothetical protein
MADRDGGRAGWSAAWGVVAALGGGVGGAFWNSAVTNGPRILIFPACVLSLAAVGGLYMCFASLAGWWPVRRLSSVAAAPTLIGGGHHLKADGLTGPGAAEIQSLRI